METIRRRFDEHDDEGNVPGNETKENILLKTIVASKIPSFSFKPDV